MSLVRKLVWSAAAAAAFLSLGPNSALAQSPVCGDTVAWSEPADDRRFLIGKGCAKVSGGLVPFDALAFAPAEVDISLLGSSPKGGVPNLAEQTDVRLGKRAVRDYTISATHDRHPEYRALFPIGTAKFEAGRKYSSITDSWIAKNLNSDWINYAGFLRVDGKTNSQRDFVADFKSAMFCASDRTLVERSGGEGSAPVMFYAFDGGVPVDLNRRVTSAKNCPFVAQTGPRIIEYSSKRGIRRSSIGQDFLVFAQGNGDGRREEQDREFLVYILHFKGAVSPLQIQEFLLTPFALSKHDREMKYAFVLTTGLFAGGSVRFKNNRANWDRLDKPHPVYLAIK